MEQSVGIVKGNIRRDRIQNGNICETEVTPVEKKLMQHHLRRFKHIQQRHWFIVK
jgi:hypothetical protein